MARLQGWLLWGVARKWLHASREGRGGGGPGARAEIILEPMVQIMVEGSDRAALGAPGIQTGAVSHNLVTNHQTVTFPFAEDYMKMWRLNSKTSLAPMLPAEYITYIHACITQITLLTRMLGVQCIQLCNYTYCKFVFLQHHRLAHGHLLLCKFTNWITFRNLFKKWRIKHGFFPLPTQLPSLPSRPE